MQTITPERMREITDEILAQPEFLETATWQQILVQRLLRWLLDIAEWAAANPDLARLLVIVLSVILALLVAHIVYTLIREFTGPPSGVNAEDRRRSMQALEGVAENWSEAFHLARTALNDGNLYRALWITHRGLLSALDRMDRLRFARWKTNTDYLRECPQNDVASDTLREVTAAYERVIYAHTTFDRQQAEVLLARVEALAVEASR